MDLDTMVAMDILDTTARGLLTPNPRLRLIPTCCMEAMDMDMVSDMAMVATAMDMDLDTMVAMDILDTTARGLLMPSPRLRLIPTCSMVDMDMDMVLDMAMDLAMDMAMDMVLDMADTTMASKERITDQDV